MKITLFAVRHGNKVYEFREPVEVKIYKTFPTYNIKCDEADIYVWSFDMDSAWKYFAESLHFFWTNYVIYNERTDDRGIQVKEKLQNLIIVREIA